MAMTLPALLETDAVKKRFVEVLNKNAASFMQSLLTVYNSNDQLRKCDPVSILAAAGLAATLNLSVSPALGHAYIIPYNGKAQFQIGVKGLVQLAHRSGKYVALHSGVVYEGEIRGVDCVTGELLKGERLSDEVVGYVAYMELSNGFHKSLYMSKAEVEAHALEFSQTYRADKQKNWKSSTWSKFFDKMAMKTVLKLLLNHWGLVTADLATALQGDQSIVTKTTFTYADNRGDTVKREEFFDDPPTEIVDTETGEVLTGEKAAD